MPAGQWSAKSNFGMPYERYRDLVMAVVVHKAKRDTRVNHKLWRGHLRVHIGGGRFRLAVSSRTATSAVINQLATVARRTLVMRATSVHLTAAAVFR